jgi:hypothetical protein
MWWISLIAVVGGCRASLDDVGVVRSASSDAGRPAPPPIPTCHCPLPAPHSPECDLPMCLTQMCSAIVDVNGVPVLLADNCRAN